MKKKKRNKHTHMNKIKGKGEVSMSLYEINQSLISQLPPYDEDQKKDLMDRISKWDIQNNTHVKYYMLLNNDKHYYTVLHYSDASRTDFPTLGEGVVTLLVEMGYNIMSDEIREDYCCEIWVKDDKETICYLLFPYDQGVVTYG